MVGLVRRCKRWILLQHLSLELLQLRPGVESELVGGDPRRAVDLERLGLATAAVERKHQLTAQPLAEGVSSDERLQLGDEPRVAAEHELGVDPLLESGHAQLVQPRALEPG